MAKKTIEYEGFSFELDPDVFDDVRFFEIADELETKPILNIELAKMGMGEKAYAKFEEYFKKKDGGKLKMSRIMNIVVKFFEEAGPKDFASGNSEKTTQTN